MTEKQWQKAVEREARRGGWMFYHTRYSLGSGAGFPDLVLVRGKRVIFAELKSDTGKLTPKQEEWAAALLGAGAEWHLWRPMHADQVWETLLGVEHG